MTTVLIKGLGVWLIILLAAIGNGAFRDLMMTPALGDPLARAISCVTLSFLIFFITLMFITRLGVTRKSQLWSVGFFWLALTLAFEFLFGHFVGGQPWERLFADYNLFAGRLWTVVLVTTAVSPALAGRIRMIG